MSKRHVTNSKSINQALKMTGGKKTFQLHTKTENVTVRSSMQNKIQEFFEERDLFKGVLLRRTYSPNNVNRYINLPAADPEENDS
jgi:hypothetical protein